MTQIEHPVDLLMPSVVIEMIDTDDTLLLHRVMYHVAKTYRWSYKDGRGIRRLLGWTLGLVPYIALLFVLSVGILLEVFLMWLVLPKGELDERLPENW